MLSQIMSLIYNQKLYFLVFRNKLQLNNNLLMFHLLVNYVDLKRCRALHFRYRFKIINRISLHHSKKEQMFEINLATCKYQRHS